MTAEHFEATLQMFLDFQPFKPFIIELNTGQRYEIDHPKTTAYKDGVAVHLAPGGIPAIFDHESVTQIIQSPAHSAPGKRRSK